MSTAVDQFAEVPSSCRSCSFMVKCFGQPDEGPLVRPPLVRDGWLTYPIEVGGLATRVISSGRFGPPLVFIHGAAGSADRWGFNFNAMVRTGYRCLAIDLPGHGFAAKPQGFEPSLPAYAAFVGQFLETLDEPAILVGASTGAEVARHVAALRPERVSALVLASGGQGALEAQAIERLQRQVIYRSREGALERFRRCFYDSRLATHDLVEQEYRLNTSPGGPEALRALAVYLGQGFNSDAAAMTTMSPAPKVPTLYIWGAGDQIAPPATTSGPWRFAMLDRAGHMPNFERPGEFNKAVINFLAAEGFEPRSPRLVEEPA